MYRSGCTVESQNRIVYSTKQEVPKQDTKLKKPRTRVHSVIKFILVFNARNQVTLEFEQLLDGTLLGFLGCLNTLFYCLMLCNTGVSSFGKHKAMYSSSTKHGGTCLSSQGLGGRNRREKQAETSLGHLTKPIWRRACMCLHGFSPSLSREEGLAIFFSVASVLCLIVVGS